MRISLQLTGSRMLSRSRLVDAYGGLRELGSGTRRAPMAGDGSSMKLTMQARHG